MPMKKPPHPGNLIRTEIIEALGLSVSKAAAILKVRRATLSDLLAGKAALFAVACELGALVAGAPPERTHAYARLGRTSGMATLAAPSETAGYLAEADAIAGACGIDASGRVRAFFARALRPAHD